MLEKTAEVLEERTDIEQTCYHCGDECPDDTISLNSKIFCCNGCKTVYELLEANNLCAYYSFDKSPGISRKKKTERNYEFLDDNDLKSKLIDFSDGKISKVTFNIPQMHCSSCIWVLENLNRLEAGIINSQVNFLQKKIFITFANKEVSLRKVVELLDSIGYEPLLNLEDKKEERAAYEYKGLYYRIGVAGFCFGNIMLLSFPEYLSLGVDEMPQVSRLFSYLNILLALPVFFFSSSDYFSSAWKSLKKKIINIDFPIALGIAVLFFRSVVEILFFNGAGYLDSLAGLVFFLLTGKLFQNKTYDALNFDRNYKSYFPISITVHRDNVETTIPVEKLSIGDRIIIKNNELIPADSVLIRGKANIDYSFVTGEALPHEKKNGEIVYAGGRQVGSVIELETIKEVSQSYLTQLWNAQAFRKEDESRIVSLANGISKHFTIAILLIAFTSGAWWIPESISTAFDAFTAVLIVACPCALALSTPFTLGNTLRIFGRNRFYLKNPHVIEKIASIDSIVFDKTGTITENGASNVIYSGQQLLANELQAIRSAVRNSSHPLSIAVYNHLKNISSLNAETFEEIPGKGIIATVNGIEVKIGSRQFVEGTASGQEATNVYVAIEGTTKGYFAVSNKYRRDLKRLIHSLENDYRLTLLSGDNESERENLSRFFKNENEIFFKQSPHDKLNFINGLQESGAKVLMIGDGLNDAGALKQSDVGISISDDVNNFSPACDAILDSGSFGKLADFIKFSVISKRIIIASFILSFIYNAFGLYFAVTGNLSPLIAAILMPVSSISVVIFTTAAVNSFAKKIKLI